VANTILRRLTSDWGGHRRHAPETQDRLEATARKIRFGGCLQLPSVRIAARDLQEIQPGSILRLNISAARSAEWRVAGQVMASAQPIRSGAHRAGRLENLVEEVTA
jgi:flagellar motor switch protein FliM